MKKKAMVQFYYKDVVLLITFAFIKILRSSAFLQRIGVWNCYICTIGLDAL